MSTDTDRMRQIQERLIDHISSDLKEEQDFLLMATMLMKHSLVLYKTFLEDEQIRRLLDHVKENVQDEGFDVELTYHDEDTTYH
tara:strand:+ start:1520 stop:1771 length:252 start_codon:yes stop_codon:yes gene_type:complete